MLNDTGLDHLEIRAGTTEHHADLCELARHLNTVNLPDNPAAIRALLETSERSFSGELKDPRAREYVFVLWDDAQRRVIGTSMIIGQLGRRGVPYIYLEVRREEKYSGSLDRHFIHRVLTTRYSYDGPTEVGGLVMHPDARRSPERLGSLISYVRFLFIAMHRKDFRDEVLAELLPPFEPDGSSLLWEAYGRRFTGLSYREADQLSKSNKEFVSGLFPSEIYATLLSEEAQRVIGEVGRETRGVEKMLRRIGFRYAERVDPFDGGPHFTCPTDEISLVRMAHERPIVASVSGRVDGPTRGLLARSYDGPPYFKAIPLRLGAAAGGRSFGSGAGVGASSIARASGEADGARASAAAGLDPVAAGRRAEGGAAARPAPAGDGFGSAISGSFEGSGSAATPSRDAPFTTGTARAETPAARSFGSFDVEAGASPPRAHVEPAAPTPRASSAAATADGSDLQHGRPAGENGELEKKSEPREDDFPLVLPPSTLARLGFSDRGSAFWMPIP